MVRGVALSCDGETYVDIHFIGRTEEQMYSRRLASTVWDNFRWTEDASVTQYVAFTGSYDTFHVLARFDYFLKQNVFEQIYCLWTGLKLIVKWHSVAIIGILTREREELFVEVLC